MAPPTTLLSLFGAAAAFAGRAHAACNKPGCTVDACAIAVRFDTTLVPTAIRSGDCSSFLAVTVTPSTSTVWVTETAAPTLLVDKKLVEKRIPTSTPNLSATQGASSVTTAPSSPSEIPGYASACAAASQYSSACSCYGITAVTVTASTPVVTSTGSPPATVASSAASSGADTSSSTETDTSATSSDTSAATTDTSVASTTDVSVSTTDSSASTTDTSASTTEASTTATTDSSSAATTDSSTDTTTVSSTATAIDSSAATTTPSSAATTATDSSATSTTDTSSPAATDSSATTATEIESPPLPSSSVSFPADDSWTATYTFSEVDLPVFTDAPDPSLEVIYPTPSTTCLMSATPTGDSFYLMAPSAGYMFKNSAGGIGPAPQPTSAADAATQLANWNPPTFEFKVAEDSTEGLFDLVIHDGSNPAMYIGFDVNTNAISLVASSTNVGNGVHTTIFGVSCKGSLTLQVGSNNYIWSATNTSTIVTSGNAATDLTATLNTMVMLPVTIRTPLDSDGTASKRSLVKKSGRPGVKGLSRRALSKRDHSQFGVAPRCPGYVAGSVQAVSNGVSPSPPNGCGPDGAWYTSLIPNLNFGGCCNNHDSCYDTCSEWFEDCNTNFHYCMLAACANTYDSWWDSWLLPACNAAADLYYWAVTTETAQTHFQQGSGEECWCECADPNKAVCTWGGQCQQVRGIGADDSNNCGGCGRNCGSKAHCQNGQCVCNAVPPTPDQCGTMCLDFMTHPRNCGRCGNVCASGYCYEGQCFTPPANPTQCYPVNALTNGDFSSGLTNWTASSTTIPVVNGSPSLPQLNVAGGPTNYLFIEATRYGLGFTGGSSSTISQTIRVCPGTQYQIDLQAFVVTPQTTFSITLAGQNAVSAQAVSTADAWLPLGPFDLPVLNVKDAGTTQDAQFFLEAELTITMGGNFFEVLGAVADVSVYVA